MRRWLLRGLLICGVGVLIGAGTLAVVIVRFGQRDRARTADVIIVLGGGAVGTERRAVHGAVLYRQGYAPYILCSGGGSGTAAEADRCMRVAVEMGVPLRAVIRDTNSFSTEENAHEAAAIMAARGWESAVLVSDDFHLWRATWIFRRHGMTVYPSPAQQTVGPLARADKVYAVCRELLATGWQVGKSTLGLPYTRTPLVIPPR